MKIRNKTTGEEVYAKLNITEDEFRLYETRSRHRYLYRTIPLEEFITDWEQAEKPIYWYINDEFEIKAASIHHYKTARRKKCGNFFETEAGARAMLEEIKNL